MNTHIVLILALFLCTALVQATSPRGSKIVEVATSTIGKYPYSWGGGDNLGASFGIFETESPYCNDTTVVGFDCSGLVKYAVYQATGISLIHYSMDQYNDARGKKVPIAQMEPGDLIFYGTNGSALHISHVAVYAGEEHGVKYMIEAYGHFDNCTGMVMQKVPIRYTSKLVQTVVRYWSDASFVGVNGTGIVTAAASAIDKVLYSWGGGDFYGPTDGILEDVSPYCQDSKVVGYDCSGLVMFSIFQATGIELVHWSVMQYSNGNATHIPFAQRQPGDLIFYGTKGNYSFISHVAVYSGYENGVDYMIEAYGHYDNCTGIAVRKAPVRITSRLVPMVARYWKPTYVYPESSSVAIPWWQKILNDIIAWLKHLLHL